jgi:hypothetical protein
MESPAVEMAGLKDEASLVKGASMTSETKNKAPKQAPRQSKPRKKAKHNKAQTTARGRDTKSPMAKFCF